MKDSMRRMRRLEGWFRSLTARWLSPLGFTAHVQRIARKSYGVEYRSRSRRCAKIIRGQLTRSLELRAHTGSRRLMTPLKQLTDREASLLNTLDVVPREM